MDYDNIRYYRDNNITLKLLRKESAPLIISFLYNEYKLKGRSFVGSEELSTQLSDYIYALTNFSDEISYPDKAIGYLDRWAEEGFLRKYYSSGSDSAVFDLTPGAEKAIEWFQELNKKEFVGTESRLLKIFDMLKDLAYRSTNDPEKKLAALESQKREIEVQIEKIKSGNMEIADSRQIREYFFDVEDTSRKLLSDFRQIEYNFRQLDRDARKKQVESEGSRGQILGDFFEIHDLIWDTDQGKSFRAFWEFLMSTEKQEELDQLILQVLRLPDIKVHPGQSVIEDFKINLVEAGDKVNKTTHQLTDQLRRFIEENSIAESKRVVSIINEIKAEAFKIRDNDLKDKSFLEIDHRPLINNILERPFFSPSEKITIENIEILEGASDDSAEALFSQFYVDKERLKEQIRTCLAANEQAALKDIIKSYPIENGLGEILAYIDIADMDKRALINEEKKDIIDIFSKETGKRYTIGIPSIIFNRREE